MGFVDKSDRMVNSYGTARRIWKWTKKLFFSPNRHDHSKCISYTQVMAAKWLTNISGKFSFANWLSIRMKKMWQLVGFQRIDQVHLRPS
jgi:hypothetical protein